MTDVQSSKSALNLVAASASQIQALLSEGTLTSVGLVDQCLSQIEKLDPPGASPKCDDIVSPKSELLGWAERLNNEHHAGHLRGPLHGIPIVLKV